MSSTHDTLFSLAGRTAFVGGATQGIGNAIAIAFARAGASVVGLGRNEDGLAKLLEALAPFAPAAGRPHSTLKVDLDDWRGVQQAAERHVATHGPVEILVHNGGGPAAGAAFDASPEHYLAAFGHHLLSGQVLVQALVDGMRAAKYGRVVNIISTSVVTPIRGLGVSNTIRGSVANWARTLAVELGPFGITVNNILPGYTRTARLEALFKGRASRAGASLSEVENDAIRTVPLARLADPAEIAAAALFLVSPAASYVTGVNLPVDGGRLALG